VGRDPRSEAGGEVCTPMSRWKSSVGSSSSESSSLCSCVCPVGGISETIVSRRLMSFERLVEAVEASERRDSVSVASMGVSR